jgi:hypothetical protein
VADTEAPLPDHTEETIRSIAELRAEHHENATALERALDHITSMAKPSLVHRSDLRRRHRLDWSESGAVAFGIPPIDPPPLLVAWRRRPACVAYMVCLILTTQRREDQLAQRREILTLELALS